MRRPTFCGGAAAAADDECACLAGPAPCSPASFAAQGEGRLARVKRLLADSLLPRTRRPLAFGVAIGEQPVAPDRPDVLPAAAVRLCAFIETHGLRCGGLFRPAAGDPRVVARLRAQLDRRGDAELEAAGDAHSAARLLTLWLRELPEPVVTAAVAERLLQVQHKFSDGPLGEWRAAVKDTLAALPTPHLRLLAFLARFLLRCTVAAGQRCRHGDNVAAAFAPLLLRHAAAGARCVPAAELVSRILHDSQHLFPAELEPAASNDLEGLPNNRPMEGEATPALVEADAGAGNMRKRKEHAVGGGRDLTKVGRSSSEERALSVCGRDSSSIRRVSSHEDFTLVKNSCSNNNNHHNHNNNNNNNNHNNHNNNKINNSFLSELIDPAATSHAVLSLRPGSEFCEEEQERRRRSERECRAAAQTGRRAAQARRRKATPPAAPAATAATAPVTSQQQQQACSPLSPVSSSTSEDDVELLQSQEGGTPLRELLESNEPTPSQWSFPPAQALLSPRGACGPLAGALDPSVPPSPPQEHSPRSPRGARSPAQLDAQLRHLHKQTSSVKRKLKRFDERFQREFGYRPSHADKMADREAKNLGAELLRLRKETKQLKEESPSGEAGEALANGTMEAAFHEVEQRLDAARAASGRPTRLEAMTPTQAQEEKACVQRALLYLEAVGGRPAARAQRDLVRPLYDRYRALKRSLLRTGTASSKDSISELATILEHEAMSFTSDPVPAAAVVDVDVDVGGPGTEVEVSQEKQETQEAEPQEAEPQEAEPQEAEAQEADARQELENLHSLPLWRLLEQTRAVREEKRALRRWLRDFETDFQRRAGRKLQREDRAPHEARYAAYKQAKARLRLLRALASKHSLR